MGLKAKRQERNVNDGSGFDILKLINKKHAHQPPAVVPGDVREVTFDEIEDYLEAQYFNSFRIALGVMLCIDSPVVAILVDGFDMGGLIPSGAAELFEGMSMIILVAIAVCLYMYSAIRTGKWDYLREHKCHVDERTLDFVRMERRINRRYNIEMVIAGIAVMVSSVIPGMIFEHISADFRFMDNLAIALFLVLMSIGMFFIVMVCFRLYVYSFLLNINNRNPHAPDVYERKETNRKYSNQLIAKGMSVFWPTVLCFYISMSFITFAWGISWIIWPVAWIISEVIGKVFAEKN